MEAQLNGPNETGKGRSKVLRSRWLVVAAAIAVLGLMVVCLMPAASAASVIRVSSGESLVNAAAMYTSAVDLSGVWKFAIDPEEIGESGGWQTPDLDDSAWGSLYVPGHSEQQGIVMENPDYPDPRADCGYNGYGWFPHTFSPCERDCVSSCQNTAYVDRGGISGWMLLPCYTLPENHAIVKSFATL